MPKYIKKNLTIPEELNTLGMKHKVNFSALLVEGIQEVLDGTRDGHMIAPKYIKKNLTIPENLNSEISEKNILLSAVLKDKLTETLRELGEDI